MKEKNIRLGIIGMGGMGAAQLKAFAKIKGVRIVAGADVNKKRSLEVQKEFKIGKIYTDYREMLEKEQLDAVTNVTSDDMHCEVALAVLKKKIPILSEKPIASTLDEAKKMCAAARKAGVINMINFSYRGHSALQEAAKVVRSGRLGKLLSCESSYMQSWELKVGMHTDKGWPQNCDWALWRISKNRGGTGAFGDIGCHILDMTTLLCNDELSEMSSFGLCRGKSYKVKNYDLDADNTFVATLRFQGGGVGVLTASHSCWGQGNSLCVRAYFEKGAIEVDLDKATDKYRIAEAKKIPAGNLWFNPEWKEVKCKLTPSNYERFIKAVRTNKPSEDGNTFENGLKIQAYLHYGFMSAGLHDIVKVKV